jgi:hypothetical protein
MAIQGKSRLLPPGLIVNADDLGIHPRINAGILSAYRNGILTSCTMLMTTAYFEETVRDYVRPAALPIGVHLSLTLGRAVAPLSKVPGLVDAEGNLKLSAGHLITSSFAGEDGRSLLSQIGLEFSAQLAAARDCGLAPTHVDSHQHVHMNPAIFALLEEMLPRFGIERLRWCREPFRIFAIGTDLGPLLRRLNPIKWAVLRWRSGQVMPQLPTTEDFFGVLYSGAVNANAIGRLVAAMPPDRSLEICIHPGFPAPSGVAFYPRPGYNQFISAPARQLEHDILVDGDLAHHLQRRGIVLRAFDGKPKG